MTEAVSAPDVHVHYALGVDMKALDVVVNEEDGAVGFEEIPTSGLLVLLTDPASRQVMWVGAATANVQTEPSAELVTQRIDYAVAQMFKQLPR